VKPSEVFPDGKVRFDVKAKRDSLAVDFMPSQRGVAEDVWLTGPATFVAKVIIDMNNL
jgi:hypothetical protein